MIEREPATSEESKLSATFVKYLVPFYAKCLIDVRVWFFGCDVFSSLSSLTKLFFFFLISLQNSVDGKLNTPQLRLAYAALVRSAGASSFTSNGAPDDMYTLAWSCVQLILDTIKELSPQLQNSKGNGKAKENALTEEDVNTTDRVHRLHLMLISTISSLPLPLMLRALEETRRLITAYPADDGHDDDVGVEAVDTEEEAGKGGKAELLEALFSELLEKTGDREKEAAMRWWYKHRPGLISEKGSMKREEDKGTFLSWFKHRRTGGMGLHKQREPKDATVGEEIPPNTTLSRL